MAELSQRNRVAIDVDRELCYGFGDCVDSLPAVFDLDSEDKAFVLDAEAAGIDDLIEAAQNCPVDAIIVTDEHGEQLYP